VVVVVGGGSSSGGWSSGGSVVIRIVMAVIKKKKNSTQCFSERGFAFKAKGKKQIICAPKQSNTTHVSMSAARSFFSCWSSSACLSSTDETRW
jgi:hypothetical protein